MAKRLVRQNSATNGLVLSHIDLLTSNYDSNKLQKVTYNDILKSQITTEWLFNWIRQHPSFFHQTNNRIHRLTFNIHNQQFTWRIENSWSMENCSYQSNNESYQPNRAEGLSPDINSSNSKVYEKQVLHQITDFIETQQVYNKPQSYKTTSK